MKKRRERQAQTRPPFEQETDRPLLVRGDDRGLRIPSRVVAPILADLRRRTSGPTVRKASGLALVLALVACAPCALPAHAALHDYPATAAPADGPTAENRLYAYNKQNPRPHEPMPQAPPKPPRALRRPPGEVEQRRQRREASALLSRPALGGLTVLIALVVTTQWVTAVIRLPALLLAAGLGLLVGPVSGLVDADALLGNLLLPLVSLSLAVILYEEGLSVRFGELRLLRNELLGLVGVGLLVAAAIAVGAARLTLDLALPVALLLGVGTALTGPALGPSRFPPDAADGVFGVLLDREGALVDLVGTVLVVVVFQGILFGSTSHATDALPVVVNAVWIGAVAGLAAAAISMLLTPRFVPEFLRGPVSLALVTAAFTGAEMLQPSAGFVTVIVMGLAAANWGGDQLPADDAHRPRLRPLLAAGVLIVLAARLQPSDITDIDPMIILFVGIVMAARVLAIWLSTRPAAWGWRTCLLFAAVTPRGVVAAGLSTVFGLRLLEVGFPQAGSIATMVVLVVLATAALDAVVTPLLPRSVQLAMAPPHRLAGTP